MHNLRLVGVHEDGEHLLLSDDAGTPYRLPLDEPLRAAALRDRPRLGQLQIEIDGGLRPRDVQAMIRTGLSAEEVAHRCGWPLEKVRRFEGPILAEREYVASRAQEVALRARGGGSSAVTLASRVRRRLRERGVEPDTASWDAARGDDGQWTVTLTFPAGGRQRIASWHFDTTARTVTARNDEARWFSEDNGSAIGASGTLPAPHVVSTPIRSDVYDVEAEGGLQPDPSRRDDLDDDRPIDLMAAMREHSAVGRRRASGRRRGPTARPGLDTGAGSLDAQPRGQGVAASPGDDGRRRPVRATDGGAGPSTDESPLQMDAEPQVAAGGQRGTSRRDGRPSVPSWDDIVFGAPPRD